MNRHNRTYDDIPCTNTGDVDEPLQGHAYRKVADDCWCGNRKHVEWALCSVCQVILEKDARK
jgi:hypothetical protein